MKKNNKGFTLIELVVVMAILAVLALLVIGAIIAARNMTIETKHRNNGKAIQVGMEKFYAANKRYPNSTEIPVSTKFSTAASTLGVTLDDTASEAAACQSGGTYGGGGNVTNTNANGTSFTINPYNYNCGGPLGDTYTQPQ